MIPIPADDAVGVVPLGANLFHGVGGNEGLLLAQNLAGMLRVIEHRQGVGVVQQLDFVDFILLEEPAQRAGGEPFLLFLSLYDGLSLISNNQFLKSRKGSSHVSPRSIKALSDLSSFTIVHIQQPKREFPVTGILSLSISPMTLCSSPRFSP